MDEKATAEETDGETSTDSSRKWLVWAALAAIAALFLVLRLRYINQLLGWDEAQLALTIKSFSAGTRDGSPQLSNHCRVLTTENQTMTLSYLASTLLYQGASAMRLQT